MSEAEVTAVETRQPVGSLTGQVKWFNDSLGYGFITVHGDEPQDVFVHQTNIHPLKSTYRTLIKDEYVSLDLSNTSF